MSTTQSTVPEKLPEFKRKDIVILIEDFKDPAYGVEIKDGSIGKVLSVLKTGAESGTIGYKYRVYFTNPAIGEFYGIPEDVLGPYEAE